MNRENEVKHIFFFLHKTEYSIDASENGKPSNVAAFLNGNIERFGIKSETITNTNKIDAAYHT